MKSYTGFKLSINSKISAILLLISLLFICFFSGIEFKSMLIKETIYPSLGLSEKSSLSRYFSGLKNSGADTDVYIFKGSKTGGNLLVVGGTHPNEPAGFMAALVLIENIQVKSGKIIIIPQANLSAFSHNDPQEGNPQKFGIKTQTGMRWFRFGSRLTNPIHQWPDPVLYINPPGQKLAGTESRNLNRAYPGKENGTLTEKTAFAIMKLIKTEKIDLAIDLHEAAPEYPVINTIVFHEKSAELAAIAMIELQMEGLEFSLEESPRSLRGLSHREWGDSTETMPLLHETANASQGRLRGKTNPFLIVEGKDKNYEKAARLGLLFTPWDHDGIPLKERVGRHLSMLRASLNGLKEIQPKKIIEVNGIATLFKLNNERNRCFSLSIKIALS